MSLFPNVDAQACWMAGRPARESVVWTPARQVSTAGSRALRTSFHTAAADVLVAEAYT